MDYILFSGYASYMENMGSDEERLAFVNKQINKCQRQLEEYIESKMKSCGCL
jgi:conjugal transfer/entry exclusion protein